MTIDETGLNLDTQDSNLTEGCKKFKPTINQVKHYFEKAYPVESHTITTERYSPCYTTGTITFSDNSSGKFQLYSGGTSRITPPVAAAALRYRHYFRARRIDARGRLLQVDVTVADSQEGYAACAAAGANDR
ncbi:hypothetical protein [Burkholderia ubonensis]|uniref:hypothetical protein n=1 Tax=Burkholderia ubonensis TaxID=101571 RepID=UPI00117792C8|nr:hypothetical protein [Burkholderia ubonensis]